MFWFPIEDKILNTNDLSIWRNFHHYVVLWTLYKDLVYISARNSVFYGKVFRSISNIEIKDFSYSSSFLLQVESHKCTTTSMIDDGLIFLSFFLVLESMNFVFCFDF